jgi:hypothetical protein
VLGDDRLILETSSRARANRGRGLIEKAAGSALRHRATRFESLEKAMERHASKPGKTPAEPIPPESPPP